jgi:DNA-binding CsgD family transcriptional regulator
LFNLYEDATHSLPHLVVYTEDGAQLVDLATTEFWTIGRGGNNTILLSDKWTSRNHATIQNVGKTIAPTADRANSDRATACIAGNSQTEYLQSKQHSAGNFYLVDLGSLNGSFVNGHRFTAPVMLKHGDRITIGKTEIVFHNPNQPTKPQLLPSTEVFDPPTAPAQKTNLTPSEERVFRQVVQGLTNKEIGKRLQISPRTVQTHLSSIMTKLNLENRSQIVRFAFENGYHLDPTELV